MSHPCTIRYATEEERQAAKAENNRRHCHAYYERNKKRMRLQRLQKKLAALQEKIAALTIEVEAEAEARAAAPLDHDAQTFESLSVKGTTTTTI